MRSAWKISLVGVTHECDYPPFVKTLPKVTKTLIPHDATSNEIDALVRERLKTQLALYSLDMPALEQLRPDLLVTQALCDVCAVAEAEVSAAACHTARPAARPQPGTHVSGRCVCYLEDGGAGNRNRSKGRAGGGRVARACAAGSGTNGAYSRFSTSARRLPGMD